MRNLILTAVAIAGAIVSLVLATCARPAKAADFVYQCPTLGGDAGNTILLGPNVITPNSQFMVSTNYQLNYRVCKTNDGGPNCTATSTDAPIPANAQVDLCMPSGYAYASFYKLYDGGNPSVCVYLVTPKTVCQINTP